MPTYNATQNDDNHICQDDQESKKLQRRKPTRNKDPSRLLSPDPPVNLEGTGSVQ